MSFRSFKTGKDKKEKPTKRPSDIPDKDGTAFQFDDQRSVATVQRSLQELADNRPQVKRAAQLRTRVEEPDGTHQDETESLQLQEGQDLTTTAADHKTPANRRLGAKPQNPRSFLLQLKGVKQLGKHNKKKKRKKGGSDSDSEEDWRPPSERNKHRASFPKAKRLRIIKNKAPRNKSGLYVCPGCGRPLATNKKEIKTYYTSKKGKRHDRVATDIDHYPVIWAKRLVKLKKQGKSEEEIRAEHDNEDSLRPLCYRCNQSHQYEDQDMPEEGFSDEEYRSEDEDRDKEIWKKFRKDDSDKGGGGGLTV